MEAPKGRTTIERCFDGVGWPRILRLDGCAQTTLQRRQYPGALRSGAKVATARTMTRNELNPIIVEVQTLATSHCHSPVVILSRVWAEPRTLPDPSQSS